MANYMCLLLEQPAIVKEMGCNARKRISKFFTMEKHLDALTSAINEAILSKAMHKNHNAVVKDA